MRRVLWIGDAGVSTGFARATHHICDALADRFEMHVLGLNFQGDVPCPAPWKWALYRCYPDFFGVQRLPQLIAQLKPDAVVVQNDPWNFEEYVRRIPDTIPVVGAVAVDGKNCRGWMLNGLRHAIFWTQFGLDEARLGGYTGPASVIPLGVDRSIYYPVDRLEAREQMGLNQSFQGFGLTCKDAFIVGVVGRNQPRKRLDLTLRCFSEWIHRHHITNAVLWLHVAPTGEQAYDLLQLAKYYDVGDRIIIPTIEPVHGVKEDSMRGIYGAMDVLVTTTQGEGFGLPQLEAAAGRRAVLAPAWSALGELFGLGYGTLVHCSHTVTTANGINSIGGVVDHEEFIDKLHTLYDDPVRRDLAAEAAATLARQPRFEWPNVAERYGEILNFVIDGGLAA